MWIISQENKNWRKRENKGYVALFIFDVVLLSVIDCTYLISVPRLWSSQGQDFHTQPLTGSRQSFLYVVSAQWMLLNSPRQGLPPGDQLRSDDLSLGSIRPNGSTGSLIIQDISNRVILHACCVITPGNTVKLAGQQRIKVSQEQSGKQARRPS